MKLQTCLQKTCLLYDNKVCYRLSHDLGTGNVDRDVLTAYC